MAGMDYVNWAKDMVAKHDQEMMMERFNRSAGKKAIFMPFFGEVGWMVMHQMRLVHFSKATRKVVCCRKGQEVLFPTADEFYYDWQDPLDDSRRGGTGRLAVDWSAIRNKYTDHVAVETSGLTNTQELIPYCLHKNIPLTPKKRGLSVDICIATRKRDFCPEKNYPHWQYIADAITKAGFRFAVIGSQASSYPLVGQVCLSGDYGDYDAAVELLQSCKVFLGTDSGGAHLASVVNACPMIVQSVPDTVYQGQIVSVRNFIPRMAATTSYPVIEITSDQWDNPDAILSALWKVLPVAKPTATTMTPKPRKHKHGR